MKEIDENENDNSSSTNSKRDIAPSSLKNNKFKGLTAEQIVKNMKMFYFQEKSNFSNYPRKLGNLPKKSKI